MRFMTTLRATLVAPISCLAIGAAPGTGHAATLAALQDGRTITWIDTEHNRVTGAVALAGGASLVGIDVRPADGKLYGVAADGTIVTIDPKTGKWEKKSQISEKLPTGVQFSVDFNPAADRLRVITSDGTSLRINVDDGKATVDGKLKYADADASKGKTPRVTAVGYTNSVAGAKETTLYDIDTGNGMLVRQAPPNDGTLNTVGMLGVKLDGSVAFDIWSDGKGANTGWLLSGGVLYTVDLASGTAKSVGQIAGLKGKISDIAILPAM
jgi:hypothetical protein